MKNILFALTVAFLLPQIAKADDMQLNLICTATPAPGNVQNLGQVQIIRDGTKISADFDVIPQGHLHFSPDTVYDASEPSSTYLAANWSRPYPLLVSVRMVDDDSHHFTGDMVLDSVDSYTLNCTRE